MREHRQSPPDRPSGDRQSIASFPRHTGFSLLEVVIVSLVLTLVLIPLFNLFSMQRQEVSWANQTVFVHAYAIQRLAEEEARLTVTRFGDVNAVTSKDHVLGVPGQNALTVSEVLSVDPLNPTSSLWNMGIRITWEDRIRKKRKTLELKKLIVDREVSAHLELAPTPEGLLASTRTNQEDL